jgi:DNA-binding phage protein
VEFLIHVRGKARLVDMEPAHEDELSVEEETRRLVDLIRVLARTLGFNNSSLARRAQVPLATLVRYFKGEGGPKIEFLLAVVRALGLEVREFWELAYPEPAAPSAARLKVERMLGQFHLGQLRVVQAAQAAPPPPPQELKEEAVPLTRQDMEKILDEIRRDVRELLEAQSREARAVASPPVEEESPPSKTRKRKGEG